MGEPWFLTMRCSPSFATITVWTHTSPWLWSFLASICFFPLSDRAKTLVTPNDLHLFAPIPLPIARTASIASRAESVGRPLKLLGVLFAQSLSGFPLYRGSGPGAFICGSGKSMSARTESFNSASASDYPQIRRHTAARFTIGNQAVVAPGCGGLAGAAGFGSGQSSAPLGRFFRFIVGSMTPTTRVMMPMSS